MRLLLIALITCFLTAVSNAELRTWTAVNGNKVKANFVSSSRGIVKLRLESGKVFEIPKDKLSKEDHEFIADLYKVESVGGGVKKRPKSSVSQLRFKIADGVATVVGANKLIKNCVVPSEVNGKPVKVIGKEAFKAFPNLVSVTLPESIISIEEGAFRECKKLEKINIPEGVLTIQTNTFRKCQSLGYPKLHDGIIEIGDGAFSESDFRNKEIELPKSLKKIGNNAFWHTRGRFRHADRTLMTSEEIKKLDLSNYKSPITAFETYKFPVALEEIGDLAFYQTFNGVENFVFYENLKKVGRNAFLFRGDKNFTFLGNKPEFVDIENGSNNPLSSEGKIRIKKSSTGWIGKLPDLPIEYID